MITAGNIAGALAKCVVRGGSDYIDDEWPEDTCIDARVDLVRAARLLTRLQRMRARRDEPFRVFLTRGVHPERTITVSAPKEKG